jgi:hypothetical protein
MVKLYAWFTVPFGRELVTMVSVEDWTAMVIERANDAVCGVVPESRTCTVNEEVPAVVGVPEITPVEAFKLNPAGSAPTEMLQV